MDSSLFLSSGPKAGQDVSMQVPLESPDLRSYSFISISAAPARRVSQWSPAQAVMFDRIVFHFVCRLMQVSPCEQLAQTRCMTLDEAARE